MTAVSAGGAANEGGRMDLEARDCKDRILSALREGLFLVALLGVFGARNVVAGGVGPLTGGAIAGKVVDGNAAAIPFAYVTGRSRNELVVEEVQSGAEGLKVLFLSDGNLNRVLDDLVDVLIGRSGAGPWKRTERRR